jgi:rubrerythrin
MAAPVQGIAAEATRRELIARAIALSGTSGDAGAVRAMIRAEQVLVASYEQVIAAGTLPFAALSITTEFLGHERAHLEALRGELRRGAVPAPPRELGGLGSVTARQAVRLLVGLERAALSVYYTELARIKDGGLARTAAEIMANEAQHATVLLEVLSPGDFEHAAPAAYVTGTR